MVTIIVLLVLTGVTVNLVIGQNGVIGKAKEASKVTELSALKEKVELLKTSEMLEQENVSGSIKDILGVEEYNNKLYILGGELVYVPEKCTQEEIKIMNDLRISSINDFHIITNIEELKKFRDEVNNGKNYEGEEIYLLNDIELNIEEEWIPIGTYLNTSSTPDDKNNMPFKGIFDGGGNIIKGIKINSKEKVKGLFGIVRGGTVKNLSVAESNIIGDNCVAGIVAYLYDGGTIKNCKNYSNIKGDKSVGGIVGVCHVNGKIENVTNVGEITGSTSSIGGTVGYLNENSTIVNSKNYANITGGGSVGGIVGSTGTDCSVINSYNKGNITGDDKWVGGIVGIFRTGLINECYNTGRVYGTTENVGGIAGKCYQSTFMNCYNIGDVKGDTDYIGGIVGHAQNARVISSYNIGNVTGTAATQISGAVGRIIENSYIKDLYYLENVVNGANDFINKEGIVKKAEDELKQMNLGSSWKQDVENVNQGYPILNWQ